MAFFSNSGSRADSLGYNLNEKAEDESAYESVRDDEADLSSRQWNLNEKAEDYHNEEQQYEAGQARRYSSENTSRQQARGGGGSSSGGPWGANFVKDSRSKQVAKVPLNSATGMEDGSAASSHDDMDGSGEDEELNRGNGEVPAEEMLSDDYYEQDGEEQTESLHRGGMKLPSSSTSGVAAKSTSRQKNKPAKYDDDDDDDEYEDENDDDDDADEDDPDDVDFEPDSEPDKAANKDKFVDSENSDEDNELELSYDEDDVFVENRRQPKRLKVGGIKPPKGRKLPIQAQRKRGMPITDDEDSSGEESDEPSDTDFSHRSKKPDRLHQKTVGRNDANANNSHNELRTSGRRRTVKKISYAESEESDDSEEKSAKQQKVLKEEPEEEDGETIERILWHQPKGVAEEAMRNDQSTQPTVVSLTLDSDPQWDDVEFYIKWKGQSYLHCQWKTLSELQGVSGFKKVLNYMKRVAEEQRYKRSLSREEVEVHDVGKEMELDLIKQYSQVERIFADRMSKVDGDDLVPEYLVKWQGLPYAESTWEKDTDIEFAQDAIDEYKTRESASAVLGKTVDFQRKKSKDFPSCNGENLHEERLSKVFFCFDQGLEEVQSVVPMDLKEIPAKLTERALEDEVICCFFWRRLTGYTSYVIIFVDEMFSLEKVSRINSISE